MQFRAPSLSISHFPTALPTALLTAFLSALLSLAISVVAISVVATTVSAHENVELNPQWAEGEHYELGNTGALLACAELGIGKKNCPLANISRADAAIKFSYGELVSAADFYETAEDLDTDRQSGIANIMLCVHRQFREHKASGSTAPKYSECQVPALFSMPGYLEVITQNYNHFAWNNMVAYVHNHEVALNLARQAFLLERRDSEMSKRKFAQGLIHNAFADHYLTDAFAAGHIRVPRIQLKDWALTNLTGLFKGLRGDMFALLMHEFESVRLGTGEEQGLAVKNSRGDDWKTRSDQHLHLKGEPNDPGSMLPLMALKESFKELLIARVTGELPEARYAAALFVPFPNDIPLAKKFSPAFLQMRKKEILNALTSSLPIYQRFFFKRADFSRMLAALPQIFRNFHQAVAADLAAKPALQTRLPQPYIDAYLKVE